MNTKGKIAQLEADLESETRWAKHYFDLWQHASSMMWRYVALTGYVLFVLGFIFGRWLNAIGF